jgi:hypothetical protein
VVAHFEAWDRDQSGSLSVEEIERAVHDPRVTGPAAAAVVSLRRAVRADRSLAPLSLDAVLADPKSKSKPRTSYESMYDAALARIEGTPRELFAAGAPRVDQLRQGRLGDCFLLVSLGTLASRDPERLKSMMAVTNHGTIRVAFGGGEGVEVPVPTDAEIALGASTANTGIWANVFEQAVGTVMLDRIRPGPKRPPTPLSLIGAGGSTWVPLSIVTGHAVRRYSCKPYRKGVDASGASTADLLGLRKELVSAFAEGRLIVGGCGPQGDQKRVPGLYFNHSYAVIGYDAATDVVTFWNPMGNTFAPRGPESLTHGYATTHGQFRVPLCEAVMWYDSFSFETDEPAVAE